MYRFGDGTPFPFEENFIDIMAAAVESCAAMFTAAAELEALRAKARDAKKEADEEGRRLSALEKSIEGAVFPSRPSAAKDATLTQQTAQRLLAAVKSSINGSRVQLEKTAAAAAAEPRPDRSAQQVQAAAARFFERTQLPGTIWTWRWQAANPLASAEATCKSGRFGATFDLELDPSWKAPVRCGALAAAVIVLLPKKRAFGKPAPAKVVLDKYVLVRAALDGNGHHLLIKESAQKSAGWRIQIPERGIPSCTPLGADGKALGPEVEIEGDHTGLTRLVEAVDAAMDSMRADRKAREVTLGDAPLTTIGDPTVAPRALLEQLTPTIRAIRTRSRVPGEMCLKRDIADGRREEVFLPRAAIAAKFARLPGEYRRFFDDAGLAREDTVEVSDADLDTPPTEPMIPPAGPGAPTLRLPPPRAVA
ncbi:MAG TPA: hypothetical protein VL463_19895 [Kofleriaceae bacterium]|nr:hypothetical protein [Kofleriaceae bacterium]